MPRFVILLHKMPPGGERGTHYDLMLESGGVLRTWAIDAPPLVDAPQSALQLADHRLAYLDYEGPLSANRGHVTRHDTGDYRLLEETPTHLSIEITGAKLNGVLGLHRTSEHTDDWKLSYQPPLYSFPGSSLGTH